MILVTLKILPVIFAWGAKMYWYRTIEGTHIVLADKFVEGDPHTYFGGKRISQWGHKDDKTGIIDMLYPEESKLEEDA